VAVIPRRGLARAYAAVQDVVPAPAAAAPVAKAAAAEPGAQRPHLGIAVNANHGLYAFFRRVGTEPAARWETIEAAVASVTDSGVSPARGPAHARVLT
jgi:hypothetical protein